MLLRIMFGLLCLVGALPTGTVKAQSDKSPVSVAPEIVMVTKGNGVITNVWSDGSITAQVEKDGEYFDLPMDRISGVLSGSSLNRSDPP